MADSIGGRISIKTLLHCHKTAIEIRKVFDLPANRRIFVFALMLITAAPWLTLRKFDIKFEEYSWWYLDDSLLHFVIYSTTYRLSWLLLIGIPWFFYASFSMESPRFLRKSNRIFLQILGLKSIFYILTIVLWMVLIWISTFLLYRFVCTREMVAPETGDWIALLHTMSNLGARAALVYPLMVVLFLSFSKKWSYILLTGILFFSSIFLLDSAYQFHYNLQHSRFNAQWLRISLAWSVLLTLGLWFYYRYITSRTYVFP